MIYKKITIKKIIKNKDLNQILYFHLITRQDKQQQLLLKKYLHRKNKKIIIIIIVCKMFFHRNCKIKVKILLDFFNLIVIILKKIVIWCFLKTINSITIFFQAIISITISIIITTQNFSCLITIAITNYLISILILVTGVSSQIQLNRFLGLLIKKIREEGLKMKKNCRE